MLRSLFTGISGLSAHQEMLDVTANNIANVNTTGFKSSSVEFEDTLSQTMSGGGTNTVTTNPTPPPTYTGVGGTNPQQVGLGVQVAGTALNFTQGSNEQTGNKTDMLINGDGFFHVQKNGTDYYTRNGAFHVDNQGYLVTADGAYVMGTMSVPGSSGNPAQTILAPIQLPLNTVTGTLETLPGKDESGAALTGTAPTLASTATWTDYTISPDGTITGVGADGNPVDVTGTDVTGGATTDIWRIDVDNFPNPNGLEKAGNSLYTSTTASGKATSMSKINITTGYLEMSNVDLARELSNLIIAERGFQANSKTITTSDQVLQTLVNMVQ